MLVLGWCSWIHQWMQIVFKQAAPKAWGQGWGCVCVGGVNTPGFIWGTTKILHTQSCRSCITNPAAIHWPQERSCLSSLSPLPGAWWRCLWPDLSGSSSSNASHICTYTNKDTTINGRKKKKMNSKFTNKLLMLVFKCYVKKKQKSLSPTTFYINTTSVKKWFTPQCCGWL